MAFGFDINKVTPNGTPKADVQPTVVQRAEVKEAPVIDNKAKGEYGDKLLEQVQPHFVQAAKIAEADAAELNEMFKMAGIKNAKMPTVKQYASVAGHVDRFAEDMDKLTTTNNAERLFQSDEFKALDKLFGIE